jgi:hypothetical protein
MTNAVRARICRTRQGKDGAQIKRGCRRELQFRSRTICCRRILELRALCSLDLASDGNRGMRPAPGRTASLPAGKYFCPRCWADFFYSLRRKPEPTGLTVSAARSRHQTEKVDMRGQKHIKNDLLLGQKTDCCESQN